ncbi:hypothetical protein Tco_0495728 [Tanacetum coccineum]
MEPVVPDHLPPEEVVYQFPTSRIGGVVPTIFKWYKERYKLSIDRCPNHNKLPVTQIDTFYNGLTLRHRDTINVAAGGTFMKRRLEECYDLIENMTAHHNDWDTSAQRMSHRVLSLSSNPKIAIPLDSNDEMLRTSQDASKNQKVHTVHRELRVLWMVSHSLHMIVPATVGQKSERICLWEPSI